MICSHCHNEIADDSMFCTACGAKVEGPVAPPASGSVVRVCPHCGNDIPADAEFCTMCGARLEPADAAVPVAESESLSELSTAARTGNADALDLTDLAETIHLIGETGAEGRRVNDCDTVIHVLN